MLIDDAVASGFEGVLAEPGSRVDWSVDPHGHVRIDVVRGVVWIRVRPGDEGVTLHADGEESVPAGSCARARPFFEARWVRMSA